MRYSFCHENTFIFILLLFFFGMFVFVCSFLESKRFRYCQDVWSVLLRLSITTKINRIIRTTWWNHWSYLVHWKTQGEVVFLWIKRQQHQNLPSNILITAQKQFLFSFFFLFTGASPKWVNQIIYHHWHRVLFIWIRRYIRRCDAANDA